MRFQGRKKVSQYCCSWMEFISSRRHSLVACGASREFLSVVRRDENVGTSLCVQCDHGAVDKGPYVSPVDPFENPDEEGERIVLVRRMLKVVRPKIKKEHWEVLDLLINAEKTSTEVANIMNMKDATVRQIHRRLLKLLREECRNYGIEGDMPGETSQ